ncbi:MAG: translation initiation factor [Saprospirales bacterium]|nr:MAG: translation initiation factor [Saprospirales bacterium]
MGQRKKGNNRNSDKELVYTTDPAGFNPFKDLAGNLEEKGETDFEHPIRIRLEKKGRGGKVVSLVQGLESCNCDRTEIAKKLKTHCGTGGSDKDGEVIIQGDHRDKILAFLKKEGFKNVKKSGG